MDASGREVSHRIKAVLCGDVHVGKSSLLARYIHGSFDPNNSDTVGVEFGTRYLDIGGSLVRVDLWDTAGQERFRRAITKHYYRDANIALLVFDTTRGQTIDTLKEWVQEIADACNNEDILLCVLGNKKDLADAGRREVDAVAAEQFADEIDATFAEVSCLTGDGVDEAVGYAVQEAVAAITGEDVSCVPQPAVEGGAFRVSADDAATGGKGGKGASGSGGKKKKGWGLTSFCVI